MPAIVLDHEKAHEEAGRRNGQQQTEPIADAQRHPRQCPQDDESDCGDQELEEAARYLRFAVSRENRHPCLGVVNGKAHVSPSLAVCAGEREPDRSGSNAAVTARHRHRLARSIAKKRSPSHRTFTWSARRAGFAVAPMLCLPVGRHHWLSLLWRGLLWQAARVRPRLVVGHDVILLGSRRHVGRDRAGDRSRCIRARRRRLLMACCDPLGAQHEHHDDRPDEHRRRLARRAGAGRRNCRSLRHGQMRQQPDQPGSNRP